jgi:hypothetical protein
LKNKNLSLILVLALVISCGFNVYFLNNNTRNHVQQTLNNDISSELFLLGGSIEDLKSNDNLRFISSITGAIFWMSRSSNKIDNKTTELFQEMNNFFINADASKLYKNKTRLSELIKKLAKVPNDKENKTDLRNLLKTFK